MSDIRGALRAGEGAADCLGAPHLQHVLWQNRAYFPPVKDHAVLEMTLTTLNGLPAFLAYFVVAAALLVAFAFIYSLVTPHHEFELIRANNVSAALAFGGAIIGFSLPLSSAISHSLSLLDCAIWGVVALVVQVSTFFAMRLVLPQLPERISRGEIAAGVLSAAVAIAVGQINAACMTY